MTNEQLYQEMQNYEEDEESGEEEEKEVTAVSALEVSVGADLLTCPICRDHMHTPIFLPYFIFHILWPQVEAIFEGEHC